MRVHAPGHRYGDSEVNVPIARMNIEVPAEGIRQPKSDTAVTAPQSPRTRHSRAGLCCGIDAPISGLEVQRIESSAYLYMTIARGCVEIAVCVQNLDMAIA